MKSPTTMKNAFGVASFLATTLLFLSCAGRTLAFYNSGTTATFGMTTTRPFDWSSLYSRQQQRQSLHSNNNGGNSLMRLSAVVTEERTETDRSTRRRTSRDYDDQDDDDDDDDDYKDLEYMMDAQESRAWDDPFHILLLGQTFEKPKVTIPYVAGSLEYVLTMPRTEATELSRFAKNEGLACLGTWPREECLTLGRQLQVRDIECRVVPFCQGGQRGWQAKDSSSNAANSDNNKVNQGA